MYSYIAIYKADWSEEDIEDMIYPSYVKRHYSPQTYWEPGEDYVEYKTELDKNFWNVVKIAKLIFLGESDNPYAIKIDNRTYCLEGKENWDETLQLMGWTLFEYFDIKNTESAAKADLDEWIDKVTEIKAWEYIENIKYGDY